MEIFQVVPPVMRDIGNGLEIDVDFAESLRLYLEHFDSIAVACPVRTARIEGSGLERCHAVRDLDLDADRLKLMPLPSAYRPVEFLRRLPAVRRLLRSEIEAAAYLLFSPCTLIGDWPTVAIREAVRLRRSYVIEADVVHVNIMRTGLIGRAAWKRFVKTGIVFPLTSRSFEYCLSHSTLGLFQGQDVYNAYAPFCSRPEKLNHHIPIYAGEHITEDQVRAKRDSLDAGAPLKLCYVGRAVDMKGPLDWIDTLSALADRGVAFEATWLGDGPRLDEMRGRAAARGLSDRVAFPGYLSEREPVLNAMKESHIFLFCHKTLESARILGEALACGCPLVGYASDYPADLVEEYGGGLLSPMGDRDALANNIQSLDKDRERLRALIAQAARSGRDFDRPAALRKRVELVKGTPANGTAG